MLLLVKHIMLIGETACEHERCALFERAREHKAISRQADFRQTILYLTVEIKLF